MTAQAADHQADTAKLNTELARQFFETIFSPYLKETARPAYIEVRGKRESDMKLTFRRFYLGYDLLIKDMSTWSRRSSLLFRRGPTVE